MAKTKEEQPKEKEPTGLRDKMQSVLLSLYAPADNYKDATARLTTQKVYDELQQILPSDNYTPEDVYDLLVANSFNFEQAGKGLWVWLLKAAR